MNKLEKTHGTRRGGADGLTQFENISKYFISY